MEIELANQLIKQGADLIHVSLIGGPYLACRTRYNPDFTDRCHYVPSWIWVPTEKYFRVHYLDLPTLEAVALRAGYELRYAPGMTANLKALRDEYLERRDWKTGVRLEVPAKRPLRNYQTVGAQFMFKAGRVLNADGMGCLDGSTEIIVNRCGNARRYTLEQAYLRFNGLAKEHHNWKLESYTRSLAGDHFALNKIVGVVQKGIRKTLRITTESGREVIATPDHVFFTPSGETPIGKLSVGSELFVSGESICRHCGKPGRLTKKNLWNVQGPKVEHIAKIEDAGERMVYDVMMDAPHHSFVANGFVVHNSGKTAQTIGAIILNKLAGRPYKTVVVCPSSVKYAWDNEFRAISDLRVMVLDRSMNKRYEQYEFLKDYDVVIIAYDGFMSDYEEIARLFKPSIFCLDEAHRMCSRTNKITQVLIGGKNVRKTFPLMCDLHSIYLLSGTPITNKLEDLYTLLKLIDPGLFNWTGFSNRYTIEEEGFSWRGGVRRSFRKIAGYKNEAELKAKLSLHMIRRTKDEVLPELPEKIYQTIEIELDDEERKVYNDLKKDFKAVVRGKELTVMDKLSWLTRAQQIVDSLELVPGSTAKKSTKLKELIRICNEQAPEHKIVVFSKYKSMTTIIERELKHLKPLHLNGDVASEDRQKMIDQFQNEDVNRVFVATLGAGGVGVTLTAADIAIFYDAHWAPSLNNQAADRLHRIGQKNCVNIVTLRVSDSVEEHVAKTWARKQELITGMIGDEEAINKMTTIELESLL